jgi:uncharacterized protein (DUF342 family)
MTVPWTEEFLKLMNRVRGFKHMNSEELVESEGLLQAYRNSLESVENTFICSRAARQEYEQKKAELDAWYEEELAKIERQLEETADRLDEEKLKGKMRGVEVKYLHKWCKLLEYIEGKYVLSNPETTEV